jgi:Fe-S-cluster-containing dehydrogenase component
MTISRRTALRTLAAAGAAAAAAPDVAEARVGRKSAPEDVGLLVDAVRCVGCRACVVKCRESNGLSPDVGKIDGVAYDTPIDMNHTTLTVIRRFEAEGKDGYVKAQCMHCIDPACVSVCMIGALHKGEKGVVEYDAAHCIGCRYCQLACPFNVPKYEWAKAFPRIRKCELCRHRWKEGKGAACAEVCPREAVVFGRRTELLAEAKRRLAERPDAYQPKIYGEHDGGGTNVLYLSPVSFQALGLPALGDEPVPELSETIQHGVYYGFIAPVVLFGALSVVVWRNHRSSEGEEDKR